MANLFPLAGETEEQEIALSGEVRYGRSWRFDYDAGEFVLTTTGKVAEAEGKEAWLEWCKKALQTERYRYLAYSRQFGQEFSDLIGGPLPRSAVESEIQRIATETLLADGRTADVTDFAFEWDNERCNFSCTVKNVRDETEYLEGSVVNG